MKELWTKFLALSMPVKVATGVACVAVVGGAIAIPVTMSNKDAVPVASVEETKEATDITEIETEAVETETTEAETEEIDTKVEYLSRALGFQVSLPELLQGKMSVLEEEREAYGETITTVFVYYEGDEGQANVLSFEEMSQEVWTKVQEEGGPLGRELGVSKNGRVVVLNTIQSNPYKEGTKDFEILQDLPKQLAIIDETFTFIETN